MAVCGISSGSLLLLIWFYFHYRGALTHPLKAFLIELRVKPAQASCPAQTS
jgi:hypothetical protein